MAKRKADRMLASAFPSPDVPLSLSAGVSKIGVRSMARAVSWNPKRDKRDNRNISRPPSQTRKRRNEHCRGQVSWLADHPTPRCLPSPSHGASGVLRSGFVPAHSDGFAAVSNGASLLFLRRGAWAERVSSFSRRFALGTPVTTEAVSSICRLDDRVGWGCRVNH